MKITGTLFLSSLFGNFILFYYFIFQLQTVSCLTQKMLSFPVKAYHIEDFVCFTIIIQKLLVLYNQFRWGSWMRNP